MGVGLFYEWQAYNRIDPFGNDRLDLGAAIISAEIRNAQRTKAYHKVWRATELMPEFKAAKPAQTPAEMYQALRAHVLMRGAKIAKDKLN